MASLVHDPKIDFTQLLTDEMAAKDAWFDLLDVASEVLNEEIVEPIALLAQMNDPRKMERVFLALLAKNLGLDYYSDKMTDDSYRRLITFLGLYNPQKGTRKFVDFLGFILNTRVWLRGLWNRALPDDTYSDTFLLEADAQRSGTVYDGQGPWFKTHHVDLEYDALAPVPGTRAEDIISLFYQSAPAHLVLHKIVAAYLFDPAPIHWTGLVSGIHEESSYVYELEYVGTLLIAAAAVWERDELTNHVLISRFNPMIGGGVPQMMSFRRAGYAYTRDTSGEEVAVGTNVPRIDYSTDGDPIGVFIEPETTNLVKVRPHLPPVSQTVMIPAKGAYVLSVVGPGSASIVQGLGVFGVATEGNPARVPNLQIGNYHIDLVGDVYDMQMTQGTLVTSFVDTTFSDSQTRPADELFSWALKDKLVSQKVPPLEQGLWLTDNDGDFTIVMDLWIDPTTPNHNFYQNLGLLDAFVDYGPNHDSNPDYIRLFRGPNSHIMLGIQIGNGAYQYERDTGVVWLNGLCRIALIKEGDKVSVAVNGFMRIDDEEQTGTIRPNKVLYGSTRDPAWKYAGHIRNIWATSAQISRTLACALTSLAVSTVDLTLDEAVLVSSATRVPGIFTDITLQGVDLYGTMTTA